MRLDYYYTGIDGRYVKGEPLYAAPVAAHKPDGGDAKDAARLEFLADNEAQIQSLTLGNGTKYRLGWPDDGEAQAHWFPSARAAIDAAISAQQRQEGPK